MSANTKVVEIGSTILLRMQNRTEKVTIVTPEKTDIFDGKISINSPIGQAVLGCKKNDKVPVVLPDERKINCIILKIDNKKKTLF